MKLFLVFLLSLSIFSDVSLACVDNELSCTDSIERVSSSDHTESQGHSEGSSTHHDCHCHHGHSHSFPLVTLISTLKLSSISSEVSYPDYLFNKTNAFHTDLIRPPIHS